MSSTAVKGQMKGLLKGLRYISQIFDEEGEKEIQIGFPTDVKHLAHIGCEDAKATPPSWMTEFKETPEPASGTVVNSTKTPEGSDADNNSNDNNNSKSDGKRVRKSRPRSIEGQSTTNSPARENPTEGSKPSRRHHSSESSRKMNRPSSEEEKPPTSCKPRRKSKTTSEEKDGSTRKASRTRRQSKGGSLTDISFTESGPGPTSQ
ncbi:CRIB domain-containing protein RIC1 [Abrus precatorius]|uniref:CRIB domain-containing protein RIC1 n=1 Tax=Abrus precatorius TaxID=3816 RepID=A0A8B8MI78_ABRPR|nr:CRIB domain-containing protein RIC1 [Abrus precatorius]